MSKTFILCSLAAAAMFSFVSCGKDSKEDTPAKVESISINKKSVTITVGETCTLRASVLPENAAFSGISWKSYDEGVVLVDGGMITGLKEGFAMITAEADGKTATCDVTVNLKPVPATGITISKTDFSILEGESATLTATVTPANSTDAVIWTSSDETVVIVDGGTVKAVGEGFAEITAAAGDAKATCSVTVRSLQLAVYYGGNYFNTIPSVWIVQYRTSHLERIYLFDNVDKVRWAKASKDDLKVTSTNESVVFCQIDMENDGEKEYPHYVLNVRGEGQATVTFYYKDKNMGSIKITGEKANYIMLLDPDEDGVGIRTMALGKVEANFRNVLSARGVVATVMNVVAYEKASPTKVKVQAGNITVSGSAAIPTGDYSQSSSVSSKKIGVNGQLYMNCTASPSEYITLTGQTLSIKDAGDGASIIEFQSDRVSFYYKGKVSINAIGDIQ